MKHGMLLVAMWALAVESNGMGSEQLVWKLVCRVSPFNCALGTYKGSQAIEHLKKNRNGNRQGRR